MAYEPAGSSPTATGCQTGVVALGRAIKSVYPQLLCFSGGYGCFNRRKIAGSSNWSLHAEGRALDVGVPAGRKEIGWQLAEELRSERHLYGVQRIMWDHKIWTVERTDIWHLLRPATQQHTDHVHVELTWAGSKQPLSMQQEFEEHLRSSCV